MNPSADSNGPRRPLGRLIPNPKLRFLDQRQEVLRFKQMAFRTEQTYVDWIRRFIVWGSSSVAVSVPCVAEGASPVAVGAMVLVPGASPVAERRRVVAGGASSVAVGASPSVPGA